MIEVTMASILTSCRRCADRRSWPSIAVISWMRSATASSSHGFVIKYCTPSDAAIPATYSVMNPVSTSAAGGLSISRARLRTVMPSSFDSIRSRTSTSGFAAHQLDCALTVGGGTDDLVAGNLFQPPLDVSAEFLVPVCDQNFDTVFHLRPLLVIWFVSDTDFFIAATTIL